MTKASTIRKVFNPSLISIEVLVFIFISLKIIFQYKIFFPIFSDFPIIPYFSFKLPYQAMTLSILSFCMIIILCSKISVKLKSLLTLTLFALSILLDFNRVNIINFQIILTLLFFSLINRRNKYFNSILYGLYFAPVVFSGIWKLNSNYFQNVFPKFLPVIITESAPELVNILAGFSILFEILYPLVFLFYPKKLCPLIMIFHLMIAISLSPLVRNYVPATWIWNIEYIFIIFWFSKFQIINKHIFILTSVILAIFPVANLFQIFSDQVAFKMFSGRYSHYSIIMSTPNDVKTLHNYELLTVKNGRFSIFGLNDYYLKKTLHPFPSTEHNLKFWCQYFKSLNLNNVFIREWKFVPKLNRRVRYSLDCQGNSIE